MKTPMNILYKSKSPSTVSFVLNVDMISCVQENMKNYQALNDY